MTRVGLGCLVGAIVGLSGCAQLPVAGTAPTTTINGVNYVQPGSGRISLVEMQYYEYAQRGLPNIGRGIQFCYDRAVRDNDVVSLRDCLCVDYMAWNIMNDYLREEHRRPPAYLEETRFRDRLGYYGPLAQFASADAMVSFMRSTYESARQLLFRDVDQKDMLRRMNSRF